MAIAFRAESHSIATANGATVSEPAGTVANDVLVAFAVVDFAATITQPAGWTVDTASSDGFTSRFRVNLAHIVRGGSAPSLVWTMSGSAYREVFILGFSGVDTTTPIDATVQIQTYVAGSNPDPPSITAVSSAAMAVCGGVNWAGSGGGGWTAPASYTRRSDNTAGNDGVVATRLLAASGAENPAAFTGGSASNTVYGFTITLNPSGGAAAATPRLLAATGVGA